MKKAILFLIILFLILFNIETSAYIAKKIDLKIKDDETTLIFLKLKNSTSLLINDEENSNLFVLKYKNDNGLRDVLKVFDSNPNIFYLNEHFNKRIDDIYIFNQDHSLKFRINNYTLCIYESKQKINNCDFVYLMNLNHEFEINENISSIFYDEEIDDKFLTNVRESWIENNIVSVDSFTILKLNEESYNIIIIPSTND